MITDQPLDLGTFFILEVGFFLLSYLSPVTLPLLIFALRKNHVHEIYVIWLFFSFFFVLFFFLHVLAAESHVELEGVFGPSEKATFTAVLGYLRDGEAEIKMVLAIVGLVVLPQWMTYILSGLSGAASPPLFVSQITSLAIWSLVKFSAALAGILMAELTAMWWTVDPEFEKLGVDEVLEKSLPAVGLLSAAFFLTWIHSAGRRSIDFLYKLNAFSGLRHIHRFFTRYSRHEAKSSDDPPV
jgi:hypothetical protein